MQFQGPAKVVAKISNTGFKVKLNGKHYYRTLKCLHKHKGGGAPAATMQPSQLREGDLVVVRDDNEYTTRRVWVAEILDVAETHIQVWYYGTRKQELAKARWFGIYQKQNHKLTFKRPKGKADRRYTVEVDYEQDIMDDPSQCLLHINAKLDKHQRLDPTVIRQLQSDGFDHHQLDITYGAYQKK